MAPPKKSWVSERAPERVFEAAVRASVTAICRVPSPAETEVHNPLAASAIAAPKPLIVPQTSDNVEVKLSRVPLKKLEMLVTMPEIAALRVLVTASKRGVKVFTIAV